MGVCAREAEACNGPVVGWSQDNGSAADSNRRDRNGGAGSEVKDRGCVKEAAAAVAVEVVVEVKGRMSSVM